jgi:hypothetical protein
LFLAPAETWWRTAATTPLRGVFGSWRAGQLKADVASGNFIALGCGGVDAKTAYTTTSIYQISVVGILLMRFFTDFIETECSYLALSSANISFEMPRVRCRVGKDHPSNIMQSIYMETAHKITVCDGSEHL